MANDYLERVEGHPLCRCDYGPSQPYLRASAGDVGR